MNGLLYFTYDHFYLMKNTFNFIAIKSSVKILAMKHLVLFVPFACLLLYNCSNPKQAQAMTDPSSLNGTWELSELNMSSPALEQLYPDAKPTIVFDVSNHKISGSTGCNQYNGPYKVNGAVLDLSTPLGMTRKFCPGDGETTFVQTLQKVNGWTVRENVLRLMSGDMVVMHFKKITD
jgi:heat shock protein HslJ